MNDTTVKLGWDQFETNAPNTFRNLWNDQYYSDITLAAVDDQQIRAHKVILSSCSELFWNPLLYIKVVLKIYIIKKKNISIKV